MLRMQESELIKKELTLFKEVINKIENKTLQGNAKKLLIDLQNQFNIINEAHNPLTNGSIDPRLVRENVEEIGRLRQALKQIVKDSKSH